MTDSANSLNAATEALKYIVSTVEERGYPPTFRELGRHVGIQSSSTAQKLVMNLVHRGWIGYDPAKPRTIIVTADGFKVVGKRASALEALRAENARLRAIIAEAKRGNTRALDKA